MAAKIINIIMKMICIIILIIAFFSIFIFINLKNGIYINSLSIKNIKIEKLYVKLDKKFIVTIDKVIQANHKASNSNTNFQIDIEEIKEYLNEFKKAFSFINIKAIISEGVIYTLEYKESKFFITSSDFQLNTIISHQKFIELDIENFFYKKYNIYLTGKLITDLKNFYFDGEFKLLDLKGKLSATIVDNIISFNLSCQKSSIDEFINFIEKELTLSKDLMQWAYYNVESKEIEIKEVRGKIINGTLDLNTLVASVVLQNAKYNFDPKIEPIRAKEIDLNFAKKELTITFKSPKIAKKSLKGSRVKIYNFDKERVNIDVNIKTNSAFDEFIHSILKVYDISVDITQKRGDTKSNIKLSMKTNPFNIDVNGDIFIKEGFIDFFGLDVFVKNSKLKLLSDKIILKNLNISLFSGFTLFSNLVGYYNFNSGIFLADALIKEFSFDIDRQNIAKIHNKKTKVRYIDFDNTLFIDFPELQVYLRLEKDTNKIYVDRAINYLNRDIKESFHIEDLTLKIKSNDFEKYNIDIYLKQSEFFFKRKSEKNQFFLNVEYEESKTKILSKDKSIDVLIDENIYAKVKDLNVYKNFLEEFVKNLKLKTKEKSDASSSLNIVCSNCDFIIDENNTIFFDNIFFKEKDEIMNISGNYEDTTFKILKINNFIDFNISNITPKYITKVTKRNIFSGGKFDLNFQGNYKHSLYGRLNITNSRYNDFVWVNNIFAFINTIPAIITLSNPGYSLEGYLIKQGKVDFLYKEDTLFFKNIDIDGNSLSIDGDGNISIAKKEINLDLEISTFNSLTNVISKIPVIGYVLLGKDNKLSFGVDIKGKLDEPKTKIHLLEDLITMPFNVVRRVFIAPFRYSNTSKVMVYYFSFIFWLVVKI